MKPVHSFIQTAAFDRVLKPSALPPLFPTDDIDDLFTEAAWQTSERAMGIEYIHGHVPTREMHGNR